MKKGKTESITRKASIKRKASSYVKSKPSKRPRITSKSSIITAAVPAEILEASLYALEAVERDLAQKTPSNQEKEFFSSNLSGIPPLSILALAENNINDVFTHSLEEYTQALAKDQLTTIPIPSELYSTSTYYYNKIDNLHQYCALATRRTLDHARAIGITETLFSGTVAAGLIVGALYGSAPCAGALAIMGVTCGNTLLLNFMVSKLKASNYRHQDYFISFATVTNSIVNRIAICKLFGILSIAFASLIIGNVGTPIIASVLTYLCAGIIATQIIRLQEGILVGLIGADQMKDNLGIEVNSYIYDFISYNATGLFNLGLKTLLTSGLIPSLANLDKSLLLPIFALGDVIDAKITNAILNIIKPPQTEQTTEQIIGNDIKRFTISYLRSSLKQVSLGSIDPAYQFLIPLAENLLIAASVFSPTDIVLGFRDKFRFNHKNTIPEGEALNLHH
jgi:hypothetical protein